MHWLSFTSFSFFNLCNLIDYLLFCTCYWNPFHYWFLPFISFLFVHFRMWRSWFKKMMLCRESCRVRRMNFDYKMKLSCKSYHTWVLFFNLLTLKYLSALLAAWLKYLSALSAAWLKFLSNLVFWINFIFSLIS